LVGYDHIDGNQFWKYQGQFLALNSWGEEFPLRQPFGCGGVAIPFAYFLTEGIEAYAIRFA
jgi:hypothetical protein